MSKGKYVKETQTSTTNQLLLVLFLGVLMAALDIAIVGPALPALQRAFGATEQQLTWVFVLYVLFNLVGTPIIARLSDVRGRRAIYLASVGLFAIGSLIVALAPDFNILLLGRAIQGFGAGGIFPVASAVIGDVIPAEQRGRALGLIGAVFGLAFIIGPILGGILLMMSWHWLFLINLPIAVLVMVLGMRLLPTTRSLEQTSFDWLGTLALGGLLAALAYSLATIGDTLRQSSASLVQLVMTPGIGLVLLVALMLVPVFLIIEQRASQPILSLGLFRKRQVAITAGLAFGAGISEAITLFVPSLLVSTFGMNPSAASFMLLPMVFAMAFGSPFSGRMLDAIGSRTVVLLGTILLAAGLAVEGLFMNNMLSFYAFSVLFGLGMGVLLGASLRYIILNEVGAAERASAQAMITIFISVGQLMGGALLGAIVHAGAASNGYANAMLAAALLMLVLTLAATLLKNHAAERQTAQAMVQV